MNDHDGSKPADEAGAATPAEGTVSQLDNSGGGEGNVHQEGTSTVPSDLGSPEEKGASMEGVLTRLDSGEPIPGGYIGRAFNTLLNKHFGSSSRKKGPKRESRASPPAKMTTNVVLLTEESTKPSSPVTLELTGKSIFIDLDDKREEAWQDIVGFVDENWVPIKKGISALAGVCGFMAVLFVIGYSFQSGVNTANKEPK